MKHPRKHGQGLDNQASILGELRTGAPAVSPGTVQMPTRLGAHCKGFHHAPGGPSPIVCAMGCSRARRE